MLRPNAVRSLLITSSSPLSDLLLTLLAHRLSDHHIHFNGLVTALEVDLLLQLEPHLAIDLEINIVRAFKVASLPVLIRLCLLARVRELLQVNTPGS